MNKTLVASLSLNISFVGDPFRLVVLNDLISSVTSFMSAFCMSMSQTAWKNSVIVRVFVGVTLTDNLPFWLTFWSFLLGFGEQQSSLRPHVTTARTLRP